MNNLLVIAFPSEQKAEEVRQKLFELQKEYLIELGDAVIAVKHEDGKIKLNQMINTTAAGAVSGTFWGLLIGTLFALPLVGAALGAASGALGGALADFGINDDFIREVAQAVPPGRRRPLPARQEDHHGQGSRGSAGRRRNGSAHVFRQVAGGRHQGGAGRQTCGARGDARDAQRSQGTADRPRAGDRVRPNPRRRTGGRERVPIGALAQFDV